MTQKEFEERTGLKLTADNYIEVETCYMNTDLDKDAFCKLWMKNPAALKEIEQKTVLVRELYEERKCLANFLIEQAEKWSASDLREKAIAMIGEREYLRRKIAKGYNLFSADKLLLHIECNSVKPLLAEELEDVHTFMDMFEKEIHLITDMVVDNENLKGDTLIVRLLATNLALT